MLFRQLRQSSKHATCLHEIFDLRKSISWKNVLLAQNILLFNHRIYFVTFLNLFLITNLLIYRSTNDSTNDGGTDQNDQRRRL